MGGLSQKLANKKQAALSETKQPTVGLEPPSDATTGLAVLQVSIEPDAGEAQRSSMSGLPSFLIAGVPQQVAITARDAQGNLTACADEVEVLIDSVTEGGSV